LLSTGTAAWVGAAAREEAVGRADGLPDELADELADELPDEPLGLLLLPPQPASTSVRATTRVVAAGRHDVERCGVLMRRVLDGDDETTVRAAGHPSGPVRPRRRSRSRR
jgi:hypothetical protein